MLSFFHLRPFVLKLTKKYSSLNCFKFTHSLSSYPTSPDFSNLSVLLQGRVSRSYLLQIHARIILLGAHQDNLLATRLIGHYPSHLALRVFHQLQTPSIFPFNAIIRILAEHGPSSQAFSLFRCLKQLSLSPNDFTLSFLLKACLRSCDVRFVEQVHSYIMKVGFNFDSFVCNGLLTVYAKGPSDLISARKLFDEMPDRTMVSCWTSLIAGCAQSGESEEALQLFLRMVNQKLRLDSDTMVSVLSACAKLEMEGIERWVKILADDTTDHDPGISGNDSVNTVLTYLYGKWGNIEKSRESFGKIGDIGKRSVVPWNAMISSDVQNGCAREALNLFSLMMKNPYVRPNHVTMVSVLSACAQMGDIDLGIWVHEYIKFKGCKEILRTNSFLATALIDMYCKCGQLRSAKAVFDQMVVKDVVSINAMIMGLAINGQGEEALRHFYRMQEFRFHPNRGTFLSVLWACCHSGMLEEGRQIFQDMKARFSIPPRVEHYACYIDLLSRFGLLEEALEVVISLPVKPNSFVWGALLGGCLLHSRVEFAREMYGSLVEDDPENSACYVMMSNALALDRQWGEISGLRWFMREKGVKKQPGCSWIAIEGVVHEFLAGPSSHPEIESVCYVLEGLAEEMKITRFCEDALGVITS